MIEMKPSADINHTSFKRAYEMLGAPECCVLELHESCWPVGYAIREHQKNCGFQGLAVVCRPSENRFAWALHSVGIDPPRVIESVVSEPTP